MVAAGGSADGAALHLENQQREITLNLSKSAVEELGDILDGTGERKIVINVVNGNLVVGRGTGIG